ncbi:hypothetical protein Tco_1310006 [Tanacetum coccineum]
MQQPALYNGNVLIAKHNPVSVCDSEETLILAEKSRLKMLRRTTVSPHEIGSWEQLDIKDIFEQMEDEVDQCFMAKKSFEIKKKQLLINNDRLLEENIASDIMCTYLRSLNEVDNCGKIQTIKDENVSLAFQVSSLVKEREYIKLEYKKLYDSIKQTRAKTKLQTDSLQQKLNDQIFKNNKLRAQLKGKFFESQMNHNGTSVNTKLSKPSTSGTKPYSVTPLPKSKCMTRSSTKELFTPFENPKREFRSSRKLFKTPSLYESSSPEFDLFSDQEEHSEEEVA